MKAIPLSVPDFYMSFIQWSYKVPLLSREKEVELVQLMHAGGNRGERARHQLVEAHMKMVVSIVRKAYKGGLPTEDLIQEGNIGLLQATEGFSLEKGFRFSTYAYWWVRQAVQLYVSTHGSLIRIPMSRARELNKLRVATEAVLARGLEATDTAVASEMGISVQAVRALAEDMISVGSLDVPIGDGDALLGDVIADDNVRSADDVLIEAESSDLVLNGLKVLNDRERDIVSRRRGLNGLDEATLEELSVEYGVTRERVRQIQVRAEAKMAAALKRHAQAA